MGNTMTTERLAKALFTVDIEAVDTAPVAKNRALYSTGYAGPPTITTLNYNFPYRCPRTP
jgi:hypothetical protein